MQASPAQRVKRACYHNGAKRPPKGRCRTALPAVRPKPISVWGFAEFTINGVSHQGQRGQAQCKKTVSGFGGYAQFLQRLRCRRSARHGVKKRPLLLADVHNPREIGKYLRPSPGRTPKIVFLQVAVAALRNFWYPDDGEQRRRAREGGRPCRGRCGRINCGLFFCVR